MVVLPSRSTYFSGILAATSIRSTQAITETAVEQQALMEPVFVQDVSCIFNFWFCIVWLLSTSYHIALTTSRSRAFKPESLSCLSFIRQKSNISRPFSCRYKKSGDILIRCLFVSKNNIFQVFFLTENVYYRAIIFKCLAGSYHYEFVCALKGSI